eukprot:3723981-Alexandrium_andersonii.AAC.1
MGWPPCPRLANLVRRGGDPEVEGPGGSGSGGSFGPGLPRGRYQPERPPQSLRTPWFGPPASGGPRGPLDFPGSLAVGPG